MNILVTGANGQLGNEIRGIASECSDNYIFTDVADLDITDSRAVMEFVAQKEISVVINCAAYTNVEKAEGDFSTADLINHFAVGNLADACKANGAVLIHVSTDYVFNGRNCIPYREEDPTEPIGVYGSTKLAGEKVVVDSGCKYLIFRTAWLYSSFGNNFVKTMRRLTSERDSINVVFDQIGSPTYAFDLAAAICHIVESRQLDKCGVYHFTDEGVCSWFDFAKEICAMSGNECNIQPCHTDEFPTKAERPHYSVLDKTKVKTTFGLSIPYWRDSLVRCIKKLDNIVNDGKL